MYNILGPDNFQGKYKMPEIKLDNLYLKMYGKEESKPQRKLGHFNLVDENNTRGIEGLLELINSIKDRTHPIPA
jgi:5-(carboxyamino)imidazole ribonucleotide synthase